MDELLYQEFLELNEKSDTETLSYEELQRLHELHKLFIQVCYHRVLESERVQEEVSNDLNEYYLVTVTLLNFIEEQGLTEEMQDYFNATIDEVVEKSMTADMVQ